VRLAGRPSNAAAISYQWRRCKWDEIQFHGWAKIESTDELETNLVGVTVVVLAVNFLGIVFAGDSSELLSQGAGIALPITALGVFLALRAWAARQEHEVLEDSRNQDPGTGYAPGADEAGD
jgi:uncharacterized membrane protein YqhA